MDLLRLFLATCVLLAHAPELTDGNGSREMLRRITGGRVSFGSLGVDGFFALSGYLIVKSWQQNPDLRSFLRKRMLRIIPGYLVAVLLSTLVVGLLAPGIPDFFRHIDFRFLAGILRLHGPITPAVLPGLPIPVVDGSLWTISHEFRCYLLVAAAGLLGLLRRENPQRGLWAGAAVAALVCVVWFGNRTFEWRYLYTFTGEPNETVSLVSPFLFGACFFLFRDRVRFRPAYAAVAVAAIVLANLFVPRLLEPAIAAGGSYLMFYLVNRPLRSHPWMTRFPDISYGVYLYGWPVESLWIWYRHGSPWVTFLVATAISFALGWLSWHFVERPMLRLRKKPSSALAPG